ncbi:MAG: helix-turn-helix transcriptional regulator [Lachnospiraceae bacterium]|nr:helix-turn-helix transcriptional regulator [Lachnospiraceae bacterium]
MNQISFVGYDGYHNHDFIYNVPNGFNCYLLILTATPAVFKINNTLKEYPAHTAILYPPNHAIYYGAANEEYQNDWIRFSSNESYVTNFPLQAVPFSVSDPEYCHNIFQLLTWETSQLIGSSRLENNTRISPPDAENSLPYFHIDSKKHEFIISNLLHLLLDKLSENLSTTPDTCHDRELLTLRRQIANNPQLPWNIASMAKQLHVSSGYLQLIYKKKFNISCMDDVIQYRLMKAKDLLQHTQKTISEVAVQCGYHNTEHFCRQFYKRTDMTPGQYRKMSVE